MRCLRSSRTASHHAAIASAWVEPYCAMIQVAPPVAVQTVRAFAPFGVVHRWQASRDLHKLCNITQSVEIRLAGCEIVAALARRLQAERQTVSADLFASVKVLGACVSC